MVEVAGSVDAGALSGSSCSKKYFCSSLTKEQIETSDEIALPPLARSLSWVAGLGARSHCARNCSAVVEFSLDQIVASKGVAPSRIGPNRRIAAAFARQMVDEQSSNNAGHPAFSN